MSNSAGKSTAIFQQIQFLFKKPEVEKLEIFIHLSMCSLLNELVWFIIQMVIFIVDDYTVIKLWLYVYLFLCYFLLIWFNFY